VSEDPKRPRGRPRIEEPRSSVSTWIWSKHHDALVRMAKEQDRSVSAVVRRILQEKIR
jgi:hypothetical protein